MTKVVVLQRHSTPVVVLLAAIPINDILTEAGDVITTEAGSDLITES